MTAVAVVVGASIGGLLAGLALARVCDEVVLLERGELSDTPAPRAGVPQAMHAHGLLAGGLAALEQLLPGLCREHVRLAQRGLTNAEIASQLKLSTRTVENHLARAYGKLGVRSRTELALLNQA